jgi:hypothetical protein
VVVNERGAVKPTATLQIRVSWIGYDDPGYQSTIDAFSIKTEGQLCLTKTDDRWVQYLQAEGQPFGEWDPLAGMNLSRLAYSRQLHAGAWAFVDQRLAARDDNPALEIEPGGHIKDPDTYTETFRDNCVGDATVISEWLSSS